VEDYRAFYAVQPQPGGSLRAAFAADGRWIAQLELIRHDRARPFRAGDAEFVRLMAPTVGRALRAAFDREHAATVGAEAGPEAPGVILLAPSGREQLRTPAADMWLDLLRRSEAGSDRLLPGAVSGVVAGLRAGLDGARHATVRAWTPGGLAAELHISVNTTQTHLAHAYEKLGVQSRSQLLARFFHETYWPTL